MAALGALKASLERHGARESGLYASLLCYRDQLAAGMPAAGDAAAAADEAQRQALLGIALAAPPLEAREHPGRSSKKAKEAAAAEAAVEAAAAADLAPLREGDSLAVTRIKTVGGLGWARPGQGLGWMGWDCLPLSMHASATWRGRAA